MNCVGCQTNYHLFLVENPKIIQKEVEMIAFYRKRGTAKNKVVKNSNENKKIKYRR